MKIIKKNVYYCDFCKKKSLRSLKTHEKHCTGNPDRECRLCDNKPIRPIIEKYQKYFHIRETKKHSYIAELDEIIITPIFKKEFTLQDLINELDYECPNCILALIRCLGLNCWYFEKKYKYDYKNELDGWWHVINEEQCKQDYYDSLYE